MERNEFLKLCQRYSVGEKVSVRYAPDKHLPDGLEVRPIEFVLSFDKGKPQNCAVVKEIGRNYILRTKLENIKKE